MIPLGTYEEIYENVIFYYNKGCAFLASYHSNTITISFSIDVFYYSIKSLLVIFSLFIKKVKRLGDQLFFNISSVDLDFLRTGFNFFFISR